MTSLSSQVQSGNVEILNNRDRFHQDFFPTQWPVLQTARRCNYNITSPFLVVMANGFMCHLKEKLAWDSKMPHGCGQ